MRGVVHGRSIYLVPRPDGSVVIGATVEEKEADTAVRAGAVHELLCDARAIVPGVDEVELREAATGLRPATPDNTPFIGWTGSRKGRRGHRPLPQRNFVGPTHSGHRDRPHTPMTPVALQVNGEPVRGGARRHHRRPGQCADLRG